jgi:hypothetical protein
MKWQYLSLAVVALPMFAGCAKQSTKPASAEMVDLQILSCPQLQESTANWYLVLYYEGERIENGKGSQLKEKLPKLITAYKNLEKSFETQCPEQSKAELSSLRKQYPIKRIENM